MKEEIKFIIEFNNISQQQLEKLYECFDKEKIQFEVLKSNNEYIQQNKELQDKLDEIREYMQSIKDEPDADMYRELGQYEWYKRILQIIDKKEEIENEKKRKSSRTI